jgi:hypothetical protein
MLTLVSADVIDPAIAIARASSTRFSRFKRWKASLRRSNGKFFPESQTILRDLKHRSLYLSEV